jgi:hypothetical protein
MTKTFVLMLLTCLLAGASTAFAKDGAVSTGTTMVPFAQLSVTPTHVGPGCCYQFDLAQIWGVQGNVVRVVAQVMTPGVAVTSATNVSHPGALPTVTLQLISWPIPNGGLIPGAGVPGPSEVVQACFSAINAPGATIRFTGYDAQGNTSLVSLVVNVTIGENGECAGDVCTPPPWNMVAWWPMDEPTGSVVRNVVTGFGDGGFVGNPTHVLAQHVVNSLRFTTANDYVVVSNSFWLNLGTSDLSIDCWFRTTDPSTPVRVLVDKRADAPRKGYVFFISFLRIGFELADNGPSGGFTNYASDAIPSLADGNWHHLAVTVDRNNATGGGKFYHNGQLVPGSNGTFDPTGRQGNLDNPGDLWMGQRSLDAPAQALNGDLDEVEIFRRALSQPEIQRIYDHGTGGKCKDMMCTFWDVSTGAIGSGRPWTKFQIRNNSTGTRSYLWSIAGLPADPTQGCDVAGPTTFCSNSSAACTPYSSGTISSVAPGGTGTPSPRIIYFDPPTGFTSGGTEKACYRVTIMCVETGDVYTCDGLIQNNSTRVKAGLGGNGNPGIVNLPWGNVGQAQFAAVNVGTLAANFIWRIEAMPADMNTDGLGNVMRLNGLPPGTPVEGSIIIAPRATATIGVNFDFAEFDPLHFQDIILMSDLDGDGIKEEISSILCSTTLSNPTDIQPEPIQVLGLPSITAVRPNPTSSGTAFLFALPQLVDGVLAPGAHELQWDGRDNDQKAVAAGVYFLRGKALNGSALSGRVVIVR